MGCWAEGKRCKGRGRGRDEGACEGEVGEIERTGNAFSVQTTYTFILCESLRCNLFYSVNTKVKYNSSP